MKRAIWWIRRDLRLSENQALPGGSGLRAGTDAAPNFRIFNPISQSKKPDQAGISIRLWLLGLSKVPADYIHEPWMMPKDL